ncbi:MAG TPA: DNA-binding protein [Geobacteraceae bacterium]
MKPSRFSSIIVLAMSVNCLAIGTAFAGFGFGGGDPGKSGLDFSTGYDVNTVTTVSGRVASLPRAGENGQVFVAVTSGGETVDLSLGTKSYWDKKGIPLRLNDEVAAKGSKAQGKDGKSYLLVQKLANRTAASQVVLRNERGGPPWMGNNASGMMSNGPAGGMGGGGMMKGGGMMRH